MPNAVASIIRAATRGPDEPINVLTFPTHERFESCFGLTKHQFYAYRDPSLKDWNSKFAPVPNNYTLLNQHNGPHRIPIDLDFDLVISQNKSAQFVPAYKLAKTFNVPLLSLEHTLPHPKWSPYETQKIASMRGDVNVFLSEYSREAWGWQGDYIIVPPGIDTEQFTPSWNMPKQPFILSVVNDWINRDWACGFTLWRHVTKGLKTFVLGDTPGLSKPATNIAELESAYRQCQVFLNTSLVSTAPFTLLEAMACGAAVVSTATTMIPQIIEDGVNGFCSNEPTVLRRRIEQLMEDPELAQRLGRAARQTIEEKYSFTRMAADWDRVLRVAATHVV